MRNMWTGGCARGQMHQVLEEVMWQRTLFKDN